MLNMCGILALVCLANGAQGNDHGVVSKKVKIDRIGYHYQVTYPDGRIETCDKGELPPVNLTGSRPASLASWRGDVQINDDTLHGQGYGTLSLYNNNLFVTWHDQRNPPGYPDIYFAKSTNGGANFSANIRVNSKTPFNQDYPRSVVGSDGTVYVCWMSDSTPGRDFDIYFAKSADGGTSFTPEIRVNNVTTGEQQYPDIEVSSSGNIYLAWDDDQSGNCDIYFTRSTNGGTSFANAIRVNDIALPEDQWEPVIAVDSLGAIYVAWFDQPVNNEIRCARSLNNGVSFDSSVRVNQIPPDNSWFPSIAAAGDGKVYVGWSDFSSAPYPVYCNCSTDGGLTWGPNVNMRDVTTWCGGDPDVSVGPDGVIYSAWIDYRGGTWDCYYTRSTDGGVSFSANTILNTVTTGDQGVYPSIKAAVTGKALTSIYCVGDDTRYGGSRDLFLYWQEINGIEENQNLKTMKPSLAINPTPFVEKTEIRIERVDCRWQLKIYDATGQMVRQWDSETVRQSDRVVWLGEDDAGRKVPAGIYFVQLETPKYKQAGKVMFLR